MVNIPTIYDDLLDDHTFFFTPSELDKAARITPAPVHTSEVGDLGRTAPVVFYDYPPVSSNMVIENP